MRMEVDTKEKTIRLLEEIRVEEFETLIKGYPQIRNFKLLPVWNINLPQWKPKDDNGMVTIGDLLNDKQ
jgi:hypothetical protein